MNLFKKIGEFCVSLWDAVFGVRVDGDSVTTVKDWSEISWSDKFDRNPPSLPPRKLVPDRPNPLDVIEDLIGEAVATNAPNSAEYSKSADTVRPQFYFNPFTGELLFIMFLEDTPEDPQWFPVPEVLHQAAENKTGIHCSAYVRFADHRSALGKWASEVRKNEGIVYDRKSVAAQNKAIAKLVKTQNGK